MYLSKESDQSGGLRRNLIALKENLNFVNPVPILRELPAMLEDECGQEKGRKFLWRGVAALLIPPAIASAGIITGSGLLTFGGLYLTTIEAASIAFWWWAQGGKEFKQDLDQFHQSKMNPRLPGF